MAAKVYSPIDVSNTNGDPSLEFMYKDYFLDYASYVILERAVPSIEDGLKPVQRRILHSMFEKNDGRYHKVANLIGHTMQYHPHGDAAIGDALVNLGQKNLLIDPQGNWGDVRTGDSSAAPRYIEARLTKFALDVLFNPQTTEWQMSYDGRNKEPIDLPAKFPLVLSQGVEGIAVGLSTKIMPHNFIELIKASIKYLEGKSFTLYPDFQTGGLIDVGEYNNGKRGGKIKVRGKLEKKDKSTIIITELPYGITTTNLIESILKANDKGKIKIKKVIDNTAKDVLIELELPSGVSPDITIDALYAFTNCEVSISPNACVIIDNKPVFLTVNEMLRTSTDNTRNLLKLELEILKKALEERWHFLSLEKIFIEKRIYRDIEECETWEAVLEAIRLGLKKYIATPSDPDKGKASRIQMMRDISEEDIVKLTEIKIKRISKYNSFKADEKILSIEEELKDVQHNLDHITEFTIDFYQRLLDKYGKGRERKTIITSFETIKSAKVAAKTEKLYVDFANGFVGYNIKGGEFIGECSDIDDVIVFLKNGTFQVIRIGEKAFIEKDIIHAAVWKKDDERTTYHLIYRDGGDGRTRAKRFQVKAITRNKFYDLTKGTKGSKVLYFSVNPNGESEIVQVKLTQASTARKKVFEYDLGEIEIKGRGSQGNIVTKYPVRSVNLSKKGASTLSSIKVYMDEVSGRLNKKTGKFIGDFHGAELILSIYKDGSYLLTPMVLGSKIEMNQLVGSSKFDADTPINVVYYEGEKAWSMVKRFKIETNTENQKFKFISEHKDSKLYYASLSEDNEVVCHFKKNKEMLSIDVVFEDFVDVKGWKANGNKLGDFKLTKVNIDESKKTEKINKEEENKEGNKFKSGDTIEFDF